jgi:hypothetical protein
MVAAMIHSETRSLLTDALTPPPGYTFDNGVATTFSLDLVTLLSLPLHLAWLGQTQGNGGEPDMLALIEALRRTAGQLTVFCQRGRMQVPRMASQLFGMLEGMVHEVSARHGGAFHPKVWLLKFASATGGEAQLRVLVLSRNLTDDRSWDVSLRLDGVVGRKVVKENKPLRTLLEQTVVMSRKALSETRGANLQQLLDAVMHCTWELPGAFEEVRFHVLGVGRKSVPWLPVPDAGSWDQFGVISPFVSKTALERLSELTIQPFFLIARPEELDNLPDPGPTEFDSVWVMDARAETSDAEEAVVGREHGLHAKMFVGKRGWNTHLFVGSANATNAALVAGINVEFMAELIGKWSKVGLPAAWLGDEGIKHLLSPYQRTAPGESEEDLRQLARLDAARERLCTAALTLHCTAGDDGWLVALIGLERAGLADVDGSVWLVTVRSDAAVAMHQAAPTLSLGSFAAQDVTAFAGFRLVLGKHELCFVLNLPLVGAPENREMEMLRAALRNRDGFVRYLLLLLGEWAGGSGGLGRGGRGSPPRTVVDGLPLFEMLARAFARDPARLASVSQVVARLRNDLPDSKNEILDPEFLEIWSCFEQAMKE